MPARHVSDTAADWRPSATHASRGHRFVAADLPSSTHIACLRRRLSPRLQRALASDGVIPENRPDCFPQVRTAKPTMRRQSLILNPSRVMGRYPPFFCGLEASGMMDSHACAGGTKCLEFMLITRCKASLASLGRMATSTGSQWSTLILRDACSPCWRD